MITLNAPPTNRCCDRCGKELPLMKTFRSMDEMSGITDEYRAELENINAFLCEIGDTKGWEEAIIRAEEKFGKEKTEQAMFYEQLVGTVASSWECKDCIMK